MRTISRKLLAFGAVLACACMPSTEHGFVGMEAKPIKAILSWIRAGTVPEDVSD